MRKVLLLAAILAIIAAPFGFGVFSRGGRSEANGSPIRVRKETLIDSTVAIGATGTAVLQALISWNMPLDARGIAISLAVSAGIGVVFSAGPAIRASMLQPAAARASE